MKISISPYQIVEGIMTTGVAHFFYVKKSDGTLREAFGTTSFALIPTDKQNGIGFDSKTGVVRYWDLNKQSIRSFYPDSITHILNRLV